MTLVFLFKKSFFQPDIVPEEDEEKSSNGEDETDKSNEGDPTH